eukprot:g18072.t1
MSTSPSNRSLQRTRSLRRGKSGVVDLIGASNARGLGGSSDHRSSGRIGRQAFEDAKHKLTQSLKQRLIRREQKRTGNTNALTGKLDFYFGLLIVINMMILGVETDHGAAFPKGPRSPFWWIETFILSAFCFELYMRLRHEPLARVETFYITGNGERVAIGGQPQAATGRGEEGCCARGSSIFGVVRAWCSSFSTVAGMRGSAGGKERSSADDNIPGLPFRGDNDKRDSSEARVSELSATLVNNGNGSPKGRARPSSEQQQQLPPVDVDVIEIDIDEYRYATCCCGRVRRNFFSYYSNYFFLYTQTDRCGQISWLSLDAFVILISAADVWLFALFFAGEKNTKTLSALRVLRLLRVLRSIKLIRYFKDLWLLVNGLARALRSIVWVMLLLSLIIYVSALFLTSQVKGNEFYLDPADGASPHPDADRRNIAKFFDTVSSSMLTLFQVVTLENWPDIARTMMEESSFYGVFFAVFIVITNFMMMSLFVGVLVDNLTTAASTADLTLMQQIRSQQDSLAEELRMVFMRVDRDGDGTVTKEEFIAAMTEAGGGGGKEENSSPPEVGSSLFAAEKASVGSSLSNAQTIREAITGLNVTEADLDWIFESFDADHNGELSCEEFVNGILQSRESELAVQFASQTNFLLREFRKLEARFERGGAFGIGANSSACSTSFSYEPAGSAATATLRPLGPVLVTSERRDRRMVRAVASNIALTPLLDGVRGKGMAVSTAKSVSNKA